MKLLLGHGVETEFEDRDGWTPLQQAAGGGHEGVVKLSLAHRAKMEAEGSGTDQALVL